MERIKIKIAEIFEPKTINFNDRQGQPKQSNIYSIKADNGISYQTFSSTLATSFILGAILDADVEVETKGEFTNHSIKQIYINGEPVNSSKKQGFQQSTEAYKYQVIAQLWTAGKLKDDSPEVKRLLTWISTGEPKLAVTAPISAPAPHPAAHNTQPAQPKPTTLPKATVEDLNALAAAQKKAGLTNAQLVAKIPKEWMIATRLDLTHDQCVRLKEMIDLPF